MLGFGVVAFVGCLALLLFGNRVEATNSLSFVALAAIAVVVGGVMGLRGGAGASPAPRRVDPTALALAIGGIALCVIAFFVDYDGQSSLISELSEAKDFLLDPAAAVIAMAIGVVFLAGTRNRALAAGLLLAAGVEAALHFPGLIIASSKAIGEPGNVGAAGFVGAIGGILVAVGGLVSLRSSRRWSPG
jgi:hypothetical protein